MTIEEAIMYCEDFLGEIDQIEVDDCWTNEDAETQRESAKMAISALRQQEQLDKVSQGSSQDKPLTLDELRKMDGEPVWLHTFSPVQKKTNIAQWTILETVGGSNATFLRAGVNTRLTKWFCNYGERWLAYRQKPEEVQK